MDIIINPPKEQWDKLCQRNIPDEKKILKTVENIIAEVKEKGDEALKNLAFKFDGVSLDNLQVSESEIQGACESVNPMVKASIATAMRNIEKFHSAQIPSVIEVETMPGVKCIQKAEPIERVGLYIPGGRAPLFSTVLMLALPAKIAGCKEIVLCTPRSKEYGIAPEILYVADQCGIKEIYAIGGAQAISAMAYGTETIKPVHKIFGPGNRFVTKAKQMVTDSVAIDMPAGPSEVVVMADSSANPMFVASDLLSQSEHGPDSQAILVCDNKEVAERVEGCINILSEKLKRKEIVKQSLSQSRFIVLDNRQEMTEFVNLYAPEHLIISLKDPWEVANRIHAVGSVFIGNYSPESAGDYASGTNHTLPTSGWAKAFAGVNIDSFMHKITYQELTREGLESLAYSITTMANAEGLDAHALAVDIRMKE